MSSAHSHSHHDGHDHGAHDHGSFKSYLIGFLLSVVLTVIPFWLVMARPFEGVFDSNVPVAIMLMAFAAVQMIVHVIFFLHMSPKSEEGWTMMSTLFTITLVVIVMAGSMWVMFHLNTNMMPSHDMSQMDTTGEGFLPSTTEDPAAAPDAAPEGAE